MSKSESINRREFVTFIVGALGSLMGAVIGLPAISYLIAPALNKQKSEAWIPMGKADSFETGVPTLVNFTRTKINGWEKTVNSYGVFVNRRPDGSHLVISNICTHLSCRVNWKEDLREFVCPCHDAHFDVEGAVVSGPPPEPLRIFETKIEEETLFIKFQEG